MNFIERLFNFSPDGGSGSSEVTILIALIAAVVLLVRLRRVGFDYSQARWSSSWRKRPTQAAATATGLRNDVAIQ